MQAFVQMRTFRTVLTVGLLAAATTGVSAEKVRRFDCGPAGSLMAKESERVTPEDAYTPEKGFGWEGSKPRGVDFTPALTRERFGFFNDHLKKALHRWNRDAVASEEDLSFRVDVPDGTYRVTVTVGDMSQAIGSIDVFVNGQLAGEHVAAWSPGGARNGHHRRLLVEPNGWWWPVRSVVQVDDGAIRIRLTKNQSEYDRSLKEQVETEEANNFKYHYLRVGVSGPPYYFAGWPFVTNSIMSIEVVPNVAAPLEMVDGRLTMTGPIKSQALENAVSRFNQGDIQGARQSLAGINEPEAQSAKAVLMLWIAGRLETEFGEDTQLIASATKTLQEEESKHPEDNRVKELLADARTYARAMEIHEKRGSNPIGENHFLQNLFAINDWWMIQDDSPLFDQAQLQIARAEHMLIPYFPARGTFREIFRKLEKKYPDNRFVKYHLHEEWEPYGDGSNYYDWFMKDYSQQVQGAPEWVQALYPAFQTTVDWSEWWVNNRQQESGTLGGGWGDDVEIVGIFGYYGFVSRDISDLLVEGTSRLVEGVWNQSEVDPELGFCLPLTDAEHSAEWTGNTMGMMTALDYGNPLWIERSMKTAKLLRDLWTDFNDLGYRQFRSNFIAASQIGEGPKMNDAWINLRAIRPAVAVMNYNQSPTISQLVAELADSWRAAAMSTARGKPRGVIPALIAFPSGLIGGHQSTSWSQPYEGPDVINDVWFARGYKGYAQDLLMTAYGETRDEKFLEPLKLEYELASKYTVVQPVRTGLRMQPPPKDYVFGKRMDDMANLQRRADRTAPEFEGLELESEEWVARALSDVQQWFVAQQMIEGRQGELQNDLTKEQIIEAGKWSQSEFAWRWPLHTSEAGPTDRIAFGGMINPFIIYTGGRIGGPLLEASVTYANTTREFAAAVLATDAQGFRLLYYSLAPEPRTISMIPWKLEEGCRYRLKYGPDANDDGTMDSVIEDTEFEFPRLGTPVEITVKPRTTYVVEVEQVGRGKTRSLAADPGLSAEDIRYSRGRILARIHNVGSKPARNVTVAAYEGDPQSGGRQIGKASIPNIQPPLDLAPQTTTIGFDWQPSDEPQEIYIVIDPDSELEEITTFNNMAHKAIP